MASEKKVEVRILISEELYQDLKKQLELLKQSDLARFKNIATVEDLISEFLQSLKTSKEDFENMQEKMFSVFKDLDKKQKIIKDIFSAFAAEWDGFKPDSDDEDEEENDFDSLEDDDDEDEEENKKKVKAEKSKKS